MDFSVDSVSRMWFWAYTVVRWLKGCCRVWNWVIWAVIILVSKMKWGRDQRSQIQLGGYSWFYFSWTRLVDIKSILHLIWKNYHIPCWNTPALYLAFCYIFAGAVKLDTHQFHKWAVLPLFTYMNFLLIYRI